MSKHILPARISFAIVGACALLAIGAAVVEMAQARDLKFVACKQSTSEAITEAEMARFGQHALGETIIPAESIIEIIPIAGDKCSIIETIKGSVSVVGSEREVYYRWRGCHLECPK